MGRSTPFATLCERVRFAGDLPENHSLGPAAQQRAALAGRLCADGVRVTPTLTPDLHRASKLAAERVGLDQEPEVFVVARADVNACTPCLGQEARPLVILTSGLVKLLVTDELVFVIGHELGHLGMEHGEVHAPDGLPGDGDGLRTMAVRRAAEISADRVGLLAARSLFGAALVMVKTASGLGERHLRLDVQSFLDQIRHDPDGVNREWELTRGHPSLPLRLRAMIRFADSSEYLQQTGTGMEGTDLGEIDQEVQGWMSAIGGGRLRATADERLARSVAWLAAALVALDEHPAAEVRAAAGNEADESLVDRALGFAQHQTGDVVAGRLVTSARELARMDRGSLDQLQQAGSRLSEASGRDWRSTQAFACLQGIGRPAAAAEEAGEP